jgi:DNA-binding response OmpR family regulator
MVIDDEPLIGRLLGYQLGTAGYAVSVYQSGQEALLQLARSLPDLVLLDVMMPDISGYDLCREIRAFSQVPVIMLTAKHADDDMVAGLTIGADDYIGKPFSAPQVIARIEAVLRRSGRAPARPQLAAPAPAAPPAAPRATPAAAPAVMPAPPRLGPRFSEVRRQRGMSLHDAGRACGVRWEFLQAIEQEQFSYIPRPELRAALRAYSAWLDVDLQPYMARRPSRSSLKSTMALAAILTLLVILALAVLML